LHTPVTGAYCIRLNRNPPTGRFVKMTTTISVILNLIQNQLDPVRPLADGGLPLLITYYKLFALI